MTRQDVHQDLPSVACRAVHADRVQRTGRASRGFRIMDFGRLREGDRLLCIAGHRFWNWQGILLTNKNPPDHRPRGLLSCLRLYLLYRPFTARSNRPDLWLVVRRSRRMRKNNWTVNILARLGTLARI